MIGAFVPFPKDSSKPGYLIQETGCWEWVGARSKSGYGITHWPQHPHTSETVAHRAVYKAIRGPIPTGLTLDHLCRNRACVNPWHLEAVTIRTNLLRGQTFAARNVQKTHCPHGHLLPIKPNNQGRRPCLECWKIRHRIRKQVLNGEVSGND